MNCSSCGHDNPDQAKFCLECGSAFARSCPRCSTALPSGAKFCLECGAAVGTETGASTTAAGASAEEIAPAADRKPLDYTPKHLADKILRSKSALEGVRKQVTVLFADVKGSMDLAEQVGAEKWRRT